ncbi:hypothetical protein Tco_0922985 [Tanacetum coccineum]|uniref:Retrotransposon gag domain-containing protein n=1 Tax=Tanacetum coccineum TaxID=301880 RepID=A0ABQ5D2Z5_9ASTR
MDAPTIPISADSSEGDFGDAIDLVLMDALTQIPKYSKLLKDLLKNKEKLEELANTLINVECSAILLNKVLKNLEIPESFSSFLPQDLSDLLLTNPSEIETFLSFPSENEDKVFDPGILLINGVLSFTIKSPHLLNDNFKIDKRHISSEASLKIKSLICFHPKDKEIRGQVKLNGVNHLKSIDEGPFQMGTFWETLAEGTEGAPHLGLPKDIYSIINHYTDAKDIWDNVKLLLKGSELTKEDHESQLYDDFEHFRQNKGETIHDYYVWFAKLINHMRNIKMTMSRMQLNSKFINNMLLEWGSFVTAVKLNRGLRDSNYDQLYAYLKQHEAHANENKMMLDRFTQHTMDPLALISNGRQNRGQGNNARGGGSAGYGGAQNRVGNANPGQARQIKRMGVALDEEQLLFLAGGQDNAIDEDVDKQPVQDLALNVDNVFQADDCDAFDFDVDEAPTAQTMFMANLSSVDPVYDKAGVGSRFTLSLRIAQHGSNQELEKR